MSVPIEDRFFANVSSLLDFALDCIDMDKEYFATQEISISETEVEFGKQLIATFSVQEKQKYMMLFIQYSKPHWHVVKEREVKFINQLQTYFPQVPKINIIQNIIVHTYEKLSNDDIDFLWSVLEGLVNIADKYEKKK